MSVLTKRPTAEEQRAIQLEKHWHKIGGIVVDVMQLLEAASRFVPGRYSDNPLHEQAAERNAEQWALIQRKLPLVAKHALAPVLTALNYECQQWSAKVYQAQEEDEEGNIL